MIWCNDSIAFKCNLEKDCEKRKKKVVLHVKTIMIVCFVKIMVLAKKQF